jgi:hypothetical protein
VTWGLYTGFLRHYGYKGLSPPEEYFCIQRRCVRNMLNALLLHSENFVDREDLVWKGTDQQAGSRRHHTCNVFQTFGLRSILSQ